MVSKTCAYVFQMLSTSQILGKEHCTCRVFGQFAYSRVRNEYFCMSISMNSKLYECVCIISACTIPSASCCACVHSRSPKPAAHVCIVALQSPLRISDWVEETVPQRKLCALTYVRCRRACGHALWQLQATSKRERTKCKLRLHVTLHRFERSGNPQPGGAICSPSSDWHGSTLGPTSRSR
jgi:hypothetical protein